MTPRNNIMGIAKFFPEIQKLGAKGVRTNLTSLSGQTAAIDGFAILHRFGVFDAKNLVEGNYASTRWQNGCRNFLRQFVDASIRLVIVLDGALPPCKQGEAERRREAAAENRRLAEKYTALGNSSEAFRYWTRALRISDQMVACFLTLCRELDPTIKVLHAPFEADPQLAYLARTGIVDFVVAEDSDILVLGAPRLLTAVKDGVGVMWGLDSIERAIGGGVCNLGVGGMFRRRFLYACVMLGCDYLPNLQGCGPVKTWAVIRTLLPHPAAAPAPAAEEELLTTFLASGALPPGLSLGAAIESLGWSAEYASGYVRALTAFRCGWVVDPETAVVAPLEVAVAKRRRCMEDLIALNVPTADQIAVCEDLIGVPKDAAALGQAAVDEWARANTQRQSQAPQQSQQVQASQGQASQRGLPDLSAPASFHDPDEAGVCLSQLIQRGRELSQSSQTTGELKVKPAAGAARPLAHEQSTGDSSILFNY